MAISQNAELVCMYAWSAKIIMSDSFLFCQYTRTTSALIVPICLWNSIIYLESITYKGNQRSGAYIDFVMWVGLHAGLYVKILWWAGL